MSPDIRSRKVRKERPLRPMPAGVLDAARRTLLLRGARRTSMGDIAEAAGIPRPTLYEFVSSRDELVDLVLTQRLSEISESLAPIVDRAVSFDDAVVEISVEAIRATRGDKEITNIFAAASNRRVLQVLEGPHPFVEKISASFLQPVFERGIASGELRSDVSQDMMVRWVRAIYSAYIVREDVDIEEVRAMMRAFLLPALRAGGQHIEEHS